MDRAPSRVVPDPASNVSTGVQGLDDILAGGLPAGRLYVVEGAPGAGKTTLALQFLQEGVRLGEPSLYVALSETRAELDGVASSHRWDLQGIQMMEITPSDSLQPEADYTLFHASEMELADTVRRILTEVEQLQPRRLVIDSLSELRMLARDPIRYRRQILVLKHFLAGRGCTTLVLDDLGGTPADRVDSLMHGAILLEVLAIDFGIERRRARVAKLRGRAFRGGWHDFRIQMGGLRMYPRLIAAEHVGVPQFGRATTGLVEFDRTLGGGIEEGTSLLLLGPAGTGKSTMALQIVRGGLSQGKRAAVYLFDERVHTVLRRTESLGWNLPAAMDSGQLHLRPIDPAEVPPGQLMHEIRQQVDQHDVRVVVLDSISGYLQAMGGEPNLIIHLHELLSFLSHRGVITVLVMAQHGLIGRMGSTLDLSYLADAVVLLRYFEDAGDVHKAMSVLKNRSGPHESAIRRYEFNAQGVHIGEPLTNYSGVLTGTPSYLGRRAHVEPGDGDGT